MSELTTEQKLVALRERFPATEEGTGVTHPSFASGRGRVFIVQDDFLVHVTTDVGLEVDAAYSLLIAPDRQRIAELERQVAELGEQEEKTRWWLEWLMGEVFGGGVGPYDVKLLKVIEQLDLKSRPPFTRYWGDDRDP